MSSLRPPSVRRHVRRVLATVVATLALVAVFVPASTLAFAPVTDNFTRSDPGDSSWGTASSGAVWQGTDLFPPPGHSGIVAGAGAMSVSADDGYTTARALPIGGNTLPIEYTTTVKVGPMFDGSPIGYGWNVTLPGIHLAQEVIYDPPLTTYTGNTVLSVDNSTFTQTLFGTISSGYLNVKVRLDPTQTTVWVWSGDFAAPPTDPTASVAVDWQNTFYTAHPEDVPFANGLFGVGLYDATSTGATLYVSQLNITDLNPPVAMVQLSNITPAPGELAQVFGYLWDPGTTVSFTCDPTSACTIADQVADVSGNVQADIPIAYDPLALVGTSFTVTASGTSSGFAQQITSDPATVTMPPPYLQFDNGSPTSGATIGLYSGYWDPGTTVSFTCDPDPSACPIADATAESDGTIGQNSAVSILIPLDMPADVPFTVTATGISDGSAATVTSDPVTPTGPHPNTTADLTGTLSDAGWYSTDPVSVTLTATDLDLARSIATTTYKIDTGATQTYGGPFDVTGQGFHTVTFRSTDDLSNVEPDQSVTLAIDTVPPVVTVTAPTSPVVQESASYQVTWNESDDINAYNRSVQREVGTPVDGACTAVTDWTADGAPTDNRPRNNSDLAAGSCYRWQISVMDYANTTTVTTATVLNDSLPAATVTLTDLVTTYDGSAKAVTVTTVPANLTVTVTYDGSSTLPTEAGFYSVVATLDSGQGYMASPVSRTLNISPIAATITFDLASLTQFYDGSRLSPTITTDPADLPYTVYQISNNHYYDWIGGVDIGTYQLTASINGANYTGSAQTDFVISAPNNGDPPVTTATVTGTTNDNGVNYTDATVSVTLTATIDQVAFPGRTVASTSYEIGYAPIGGNLVVDPTVTRAYDQPYVFAPDGITFDVTGEGWHTVTFWSTDDIANDESPRTTIDFFIDSIAPVMTFTAPVTPVTTSDSNYEVTWTKYDAAAGYVTPSVQREVGTPVDGACDAVSDWTADGNLTTADSPRNDTDLISGDCYRWTISGTDSAGNISDTVTSATVLPAYTPVAAILSFTSDLHPTYDGAPKPATVTTDQGDLTGVVVTYEGTTNGGANYGPTTSAPTEAGSYTVTATLDNVGYSADPISDTLVIATATATLSFPSGAALHPTYDGSPKPVTVTTDPPGLSGVVVFYGGTGLGQPTTPPTEAGIYGVNLEFDNPNYTASMPGGVALFVEPAAATLSASDPNPTYDGTPKNVTVTTDPADLPVAVTYFDNNGPTTTPPTAAGYYTVTVELVTNNYVSNAAFGALTINPASATLGLSGLARTYDGTPKAVTVTTNPTGLAVSVTYEGIDVTYDISSSPPTAVGSYTVAATLDNPNYTATPVGGTLVISAAAPTDNGGGGSTLPVGTIVWTFGDANAHFAGATIVADPTSISSDQSVVQVQAGVHDSDTISVTAESHLTVGGIWRLVGHGETLAVCFDDNTCAPETAGLGDINGSAVFALDYVSFSLTVTVPADATSAFLRWSVGSEGDMDQIAFSSNGQSGQTLLDVTASISLTNLPSSINFGSGIAGDTVSPAVGPDFTLNVVTNNNDGYTVKFQASDMLGNGTTPDTIAAAAMTIGATVGTANTGATGSGATTVTTAYAAILAASNERSLALGDNFPVNITLHIPFVETATYGGTANVVASTL